MVNMLEVRRVREWWWSVGFVRIKCMMNVCWSGGWVGDGDWWFVWFVVYGGGEVVVLVGFLMLVVVMRLIFMVIVIWILFFMLMRRMRMGLVWVNGYVEEVERLIVMLCVNC